MVLQNVIFAIDECADSRLFYRKIGGAVMENDHVILNAGAEVSTYTYMNLLDADFFCRRTEINGVELFIDIKGECEIKLCRKNEKHFDVISSYDIFETAKKRVSISIRPWEFYGKIYFSVHAVSKTEIFRAFYSCEKSCTNDIKLGVVICTYKRRNFVERNTAKLLESLFFDKSSELYGKLSICVVDNGGELEEVNENNCRIIRNSNTGGSGGFSKGMDMLDENSITNVVLMDDDVSFCMETFYRLFALLSFGREAVYNSVIAGRMFRLDKPQIQYTACEVWNRGTIEHIGFQRDMTKEYELYDVNVNEGDYTGFWFACYPMEYVKGNRPLPFFLHCDDVEYGLRYAKTPVICNGIQVWHETYEYRINPLISYYDTRNPLFVNLLYNMFDASEELEKWKNNITEKHIKRDFVTEYYIIRGMSDFLKGMEWLCRIDSAKYNERLKKPRHMYRLRNAILWRTAVRKYNKKYKVKYGE